MAAKWLICNLGKEDYINSLAYSVSETGRQAEIISLKQVAEIYETINTEIDCVIPVGSIWGSSALKEARPNWIGNFHDRNNFLCTRYYSYLGRYLTQKKYVMMTLAEVVRNKKILYDFLNKNDQIFIRPDSGEKDFCGEIVHKDRFNAWAESTLDGMLNLSPSLLCVVSQPVEIKKEIRLVIADKKVVTGSTYRIAKHILKEPLEDQSDKNEIIKFAEEALSRNCDFLPPIHLLDIAVEENGLSIMEIGCFCCAGLYACDLRKIASGVSEAVEKHFESVYPSLTGMHTQS